MNLSGNAVRYWMNKENISLEHLLVVVDDLSLPLGALRLKASGSNGGHNGLGNIQSVIGTQQYSRLRVGIGNDFPKGAQVDWVLGKYDEEDMKTLTPAIDTSIEIIKSFVLAGVNITMNQYNKSTNNGRHCENRQMAVGVKNIQDTLTGRQCLQERKSNHKRRQRKALAHG